MMKTLQMKPAYSNFSDYHFNHSTDEAAMPVIKLDFHGQLMYANRAAIELLTNMGGVKSGRSVAYIISKYPGLLNPECTFDITIRSGNFNYYFSAVGFREGGFVGLYCYEIEITGFGRGLQIHEHS